MVSRRLFRPRVKVAHDLDLALLFYFFLCLSNLPHLLSPYPTALPPFNFVDQSWWVDLGVRYANGSLWGKDFFFTQGPLSQWLYAFFPNLLGFSIGNLVKYGHIFSIVFCFFLVGLIFRIILPCKDYVRVGGILAFCLLWWMPNDLRSLIPASSLALAYFIFSRLRSTRLKRVLGAALWALLPIVAFLLSIEQGIYSAVGLLLFCASCLLLDRTRQTRTLILEYVLFAIIWLSVLVLLINVWLRESILDFSVWHMSFLLAASYRWAMAWPWEAGYFLLPTVVLAALAVVAMCLWLKVENEQGVKFKALLIAWFLLGCMHAETALVRSSTGHITQGLTTLVLLICGGTFLVVSQLRNRLAKAFALLVLMAFLLPLGRDRSDQYAPNRVAWLRQASFYHHIWGSVFDSGARARDFVLQANHCPDGWKALAGACWVNEDAKRLGAVSQALRSRSTAQERVYAFPYETIFAHIAERTSRPGILQAYVGTGPELEQVITDSLRRYPSGVVVYGIDGEFSASIDWVPNVSRNSEVFDYIRTHYRVVDEPYRGVCLLERLRHSIPLPISEEIPLHLRRINLPQEDRPYPIAGLKPEVAFPPIFRLTVAVRYPWWARMLKVSVIKVVYDLEDGTTIEHPIVLPPDGKEHSILLTPFYQRPLLRAFPGGESFASEGKRPSVRTIYLSIRKMDFLSVLPSEVRITRLTIERPT